MFMFVMMFMFRIAMLTMFMMMFVVVFMFTITMLTMFMMMFVFMVVFMFTVTMLAVFMMMFMFVVMFIFTITVLTMFMMMFVLMVMFIMFAMMFCFFNKSYAVLNGIYCFLKRIKKFMFIKVTFKEKSFCRKNNGNILYSIKLCNSFFDFHSTVRTIKIFESIFSCRHNQFPFLFSKICSNPSS